MPIVVLKARHLREGGDPEGEFFQALKVKDKRKVNLVNKKTIIQQTDHLYQSYKLMMWPLKSGQQILLKGE